MTERAAPFHCPYCAEEDLRPFGETHGVWRCGACLRVFALSYRGMAPGPGSEEPDVTSEQRRREAARQASEPTLPSEQRRREAARQASEPTLPSEQRRREAARQASEPTLPSEQRRREAARQASERDEPSGDALLPSELLP